MPASKVKDILLIHFLDIQYPVIPTQLLGIIISHILVISEIRSIIPAHLLWISIVVDLDPGGLASSRCCLSATTTEQEMFVSVVARGERVSMAELEVVDEWMEIRPPSTMIIFSLSLQKKENSKSPLSTTLRSRLATQVRVTSPTPPATR